jgi:hypothetical protein
MKAAPHYRGGAADNRKLFGFPLLVHLFYLLALIFNLLLLLLQLALGLLILYLLVLQLIANQISAAGAERATDCRACRRMTHRGTDYSPSTTTQQSADAGAFFALAQRLPRASCNQQGRGERQRRCS